MITGKTLIGWGYKPGPWFAEAVAAAEGARRAGADEVAIRAIVERFAPPPGPPTVGLRRAGELCYHLNVHAEEGPEAQNIASVELHMRELMRVPTIVAGAVMPDACPSGSAPGTVPVGGIAAAKDAIHPGMHSADICCSMAVTIFGDVAPTALLDAGMMYSHFGGGGRPRGSQLRPPASVLAQFEENPYLKPLVSAAIEHFATQGDGNHFFYVGRVTSTGQVALVTHHGSRKPGAMLYKAGMATAERFRSVLSPETPKHNAWIPVETQEGKSYWQALQLIRAWTKANHYAIHDLIAHALGLQRKDRFWNEHNFVFRKSDGLFYHAKGATPAWSGFAEDSCGLTLIPLNMAEPILITRGLDAPNALGFAPHGAGRNFSRTAYMRAHADKPEEDIVAEQTAGIDARFFCGIPDISELPGAYKNAAAMRAQIAAFGLAEVVDTIDPVGCIMAGDWQRDAPWRRKKSPPQR
ncbi:MAG TPA: RtcB family protein [Hyphomicrobiaceae bacterium]|nr:RtcB family protein [Hyphomicrobiaceae bacterium]